MKNEIDQEWCGTYYLNDDKAYTPCQTRKWISVTDKLPEKALQVLVSDGSQIGIAFIQTLNGRFTQVNTWNDWIHESITHWMPLPEPPK